MIGGIEFQEIGSGAASYRPFTGLLQTPSFLCFYVLMFLYPWGFVTNWGPVRDLI